MFNKVLGEHRNRRQQVNTDTVQQIEELNGKIRELVEQESPRFVCGKLLYDVILNCSSNSICGLSAVSSPACSSSASNWLITFSSITSFAC